jgi:hypothetical protein
MVHILRTTILGVAGIWIFALGWSRLSMLSDVWTKEYKAAGEFAATHQRCIRDHTFQHDAPETCQTADVEKSRWPFLRSVGVVFDRTHSCVNYPCSDILRSIFDSWAGLVFVCAIGITATFVVCSRVMLGAERGEYGRHSGPGPNAWQTQGANMVAYDTYPGAAVLHLPPPPGHHPDSGAFQRVASLVYGYLPQRETRKAKLI